MSSYSTLVRADTHRLVSPVTKQKDIRHIKQDFVIYTMTVVHIRAYCSGEDWGMQ